MSKIYVKQEPYVNEHGIWFPVHEYVEDGTESAYRCVMTRGMFVEAYNKWIKDAPYGFGGQDDADDWCD